MFYGGNKMKKIIGIMVFILVSININAQEDWVQNIVNKSLSLIGNPVPNDFRRMDRTSDT